MDGLDGYEVCTRLQADRETNNIPIIFISALSEEEDEARGLSLGAVDYIFKPFRPTIVRARIRTQLELKRHRDRLEDMVAEKTRELHEVLATLKTLRGLLPSAHRARKFATIRVIGIVLRTSSNIAPRRNSPMASARTVPAD